MNMYSKYLLVPVTIFTIVAIVAAIGMLGMAAVAIPQAHAHIPVIGPPTKKCPPPVIGGPPRITVSPVKMGSSYHRSLGKSIFFLAVFNKILQTHPANLCALDKGYRPI
jgi:hypothetical protein